MRVLLGFWLGVMAVLLVGAAYQLSPIDQEQNVRLDAHDIQVATLNAWAFGATQEWALSPTPTRPGVTATYVPTSTQVTATVVPLASATIAPTALPVMRYAGNISGAKRWVRLCPATNCEIVASIAPGGTVVVDPGAMVIAEGYEWWGLWNQAGWIAAKQLNPPVRYLALRP